MRPHLALFAACLAASSLCLSQTPPIHHGPAKRALPVSAGPEVILFNGIIYSGMGFANDQPQVVQAMAVGGGKILAVGDNATITKLAGPKTRLRDLDSAKTSIFIFPGFNDAHTHLAAQARPRSTWT